MTEQQYKELLEALGIGTGKSSADTKELLDAKYNEYLDRTDAEAEQMVSDIEDALDYVDDLIVKMGGGIALAPEETEEAEESGRDSLAGRTAGRKGAITYTSSSAVGGTTTGSGVQGGTTSAGTTSKPSHPWFYSTTGDKNIEDLFKLAKGDLTRGDFQHAESVYDTILRTEMTNVGAYMGIVLAKYSLQEPKDIATCYTDGLENDQDLMRAESCGNDKQKKFIQDALEERRKGKIYVEAETVLRTSKDSSRLLQTATKFDSISDYRDAKEKAKECREESEKVKIEQENQNKEKIYKKANVVLQNSDDITKVMNAATEFKSLGEYRDAPQKVEECEETIKRLRKIKIKKERKERKERRKKWLIRIVVFGILVNIINYIYFYCMNESVISIMAYLPNFAYTKEVSVYRTSSPYYISFAPLEKLWIEEDAVNLEKIYLPKGVKEIHIDHPMKKVTIPEHAKVVSINGGELSDLEIPYGVVSLDLYNISSELKELKVPESVKHLSLNGVSDELAENLILSSGLTYLEIGYRWGYEECITDEGLRKIELPESLQFLKLEACNNLEEIEINSLLEGLSVKSSSLNVLTLSGDIKNVNCSGNGNGNTFELIITGNVENLSGYGVEKCTLGNENLAVGNDSEIEILNGDDESAWPWDEIYDMQDEAVQ